MVCKSRYCQEADERLLPSWEQSGVGRFMESPHDFDAVHWDHEPRTSEKAPPRCCRHLAGSAFIRSLCRQDAGSTLGFMESPLSLFRMHWDHELVRVDATCLESRLQAVRTG